MYESQRSGDEGGAEWDKADLEYVTICLACGGEQFADRHEDLEDLLGGLPGRWGFLACSVCGSLHLNPRPTPAAIGRAYPTDYVTHGSGGNANSRDNGSSWVWRLANGYLNARFGATRYPATRIGRWLVPVLWPLRQQLDYFFRHLPAKPGRVLDVGCGNGAFLLRARSAGWVVQGIEPDPLAAMGARQEGLDVANCAIEAFAPAAPFDQITLSHVFEHLHAPDEALRRMRPWLRPGGTLWMSLPNPSGLGHLVFGRNWFSLDPPRHLFLPPPRQVVAMLRAAGYQDVRLMRRGRGARSSILPSVEYARRRSRGFACGGALIASVIDVLGSWFPALSEEIVVIAKRRK